MSRKTTTLPFFHRRSFPTEKRRRRLQLRRENSQFLSRLPLINSEDEPAMDESISKSPSNNNTPVISPTTIRPLAHPYPPPSALAALMDRRHSARRLGRRELSQLLQEHRGSFLSTASMALIGVAPRTSKSSSASDKDASLGSQFWSSEQEKASVWRRIKQFAQHLYEKSRLKYLLPLLILVGYSFLGGAVIYWIESPIELWQIGGKQKFLDDQKFFLTETVWKIRENRLEKREAIMTLRETVYWYTIATLYMDGNFTRLPPSIPEVNSKVKLLRKYTEEMAQRCWEISEENVGNRTDAHLKVQASLVLFEEFTGVSTAVKSTWTFSNALFLAITIYTTIGYGSVAPHTVAGRVATIIYAVIGIPIYVMIIHKLGRFCLKLLHKFWKFALRLTRCWRCSRRSRKSRRQSLVPSDDEQSVNNIPVSLAVGVTFAWMLTCAGVCCLFFETSWDYFTSFYFFFISLTTIGFGDVTPTHPEYMFTMFGLIIVGLSLVSMCINVVQLKLELLFEEMMLALMEEYEKSGQLIDGKMVGEPVDFQRGLGFTQMFKLWKKKRAAKKMSGGNDDVVTIPATGILLPLMARQRQAAVFRELQRRAREKTVGTQTDKWTYDHWRGWIEKHQGTQTDWTPGFTDTSSLITCSSGLMVNAQMGSGEQYHSDLSLYSHVGCFDKHGIEFEPTVEPVRPWTSMDTNNSKPAAVYHTSSTLTPFTRIDRNASTSALPNMRPQHQSIWRHGHHSIFDPKLIAHRGVGHHPYQYQGHILHPRAAHPSTHNSPIPYYYRTSPSAFAHHPQFDHGRYWLVHFRPEAPPGGGVPTMAIKRQAKDTSCDDFKSLIKEIGCRLDECRHIVKQSETDAPPGRSKKLGT